MTDLDSIRAAMGHPRVVVNVNVGRPRVVTSQVQRAVAQPDEPDPDPTPTPDDVPEID